MAGIFTIGDTINLGRENSTLTNRRKAINKSFNEQYNQPQNPFTDATRDNYQTYPYDYFCGTDAKIFFGDIWVDDIITIQYNINQTKTPIYGYADQEFAAVALGNIIVQGTLAIAFKETGYLNVIQYMLENQRNTSTKALGYKLKNMREQSANRMSKYVPGLTEGPDVREGTGLSYSATGSPQIIRQQETIENILMSKKGNLAAESLSKTIIGDTSERDFEDFAEVLEDTIWGDSNGKPFSLKKGMLKRADEFDYIYNPATGAPAGVRVSKGHDFSDCLNILITFGDINDYRAEHTLVSLNDVHFQSQGMIVTPTGDPIAESYSFFCKTINQNLGTSTIKIDPIKLDVGVDYKLSKLEDITQVENFLKDKDTNNTVMIQFIASMSDSGWSSDSQRSLEVPFIKRNTTPFADQLIVTVEQTINDPTNKVQTNKKQYIIEAAVVNSNTESNAITMILDQGITGSYTYRVISPSRSNFSAVSVFTREDMFKVPTAEELTKDSIPSKLMADKTRLDSAVNAAEKERQTIEDKITYAGTEDEQAKINKEQNKFDTMLVKANKDNRISAYEQWQLDRQNKKLVDLQVKKENIRETGLGQRRLSRGEDLALRQNINDLQDNAAKLNSLADEYQTHNEIVKDYLAKEPPRPVSTVVDTDKIAKALEPVKVDIPKEDQYTYTNQEFVGPPSEQSISVAQQMKPTPEKTSPFFTAAEIKEINQMIDKMENKNKGLAGEKGSSFIGKLVDKKIEDIFNNTTITPPIKGEMTLEQMLRLNPPKQITTLTATNLAHQKDTVGGKRDTTPYEKGKVQANDYGSYQDSNGQWYTKVPIKGTITNVGPTSITIQPENYPGPITLAHIQNPYGFYSALEKAYGQTNPDWKYAKKVVIPEGSPPIAFPVLPGERHLHVQTPVPEQEYPIQGYWSESAKKANMEVVEKYPTSRPPTVSVGRVNIPLTTKSLDPYVIGSKNVGEIWNKLFPHK